MLPPSRIDDFVIPAELPEELPILASNELIPFPWVLLSYEVSQPWETEPVRLALAKGDLIILATFSGSQSMPTATSLMPIAVLGKIIKFLDFSVERKKVLVQGLARISIADIHKDHGAMFASFTLLKERELDDADLKGCSDMAAGINQYLQILVEREYLPEEMLLVSDEGYSPGKLSDILVAQLSQDVEQGQSALVDLNPLSRLSRANSLIADICNQVLVAESVQERVKDKLQKGQREFYLREQIRHIQDELGQTDSQTEDLKDLKEQIDALKLPQEAKAEAHKQYFRLQNLSPEAGEYSLIRTYLDWICDLPWNKRSRDRLNPKKAAQILDQDHYGLKKAKERILEYLSVRRLNRSAKGPILCFVGPPGVGKTSLGRSVARALGRSYYRISLGGVRDEAEIRGHRRTYLGAMPGRLLQALKSAGTMNPVIVLDELDKLGNDFRGDPASALLEVLDPHQNREFRDHYLNLTFDLSDVLFIGTANTIDTIPDALLDRLEIIFVSGYTLEEKVKIASLFVVPRQLEDNGLVNKQVIISNPSLVLLIERYTEEAGVRNLEREIGSLARKVARRFIEDGKLIKSVTPDLVQTFLGPPRYDPEQVSRGDCIGVANGLAWTVNGGEIMVVEASVAAGSGNLTMTGQLGNVMQESAQAALSYARAHAIEYGISAGFYAKSDIHIHVPAGATPKDGPSAGVTIVCAVISVLTQRSISGRFAMTGEVTLSGKVLPVGGLKEKLLAAQRAGMEKVFIPKGNEKDLEEIPKDQRRAISVALVSTVDEILAVCLSPKKKRAVKGPNKKAKKSKTT
jgi:ATP-dependent Lon protease